MNRIKKYSLGMKQKLGIAAAIMEDPEIIISCHDSEELEFLSDEIFFMETGKLKPYKNHQKEGASCEKEK